MSAKNKAARARQSAPRRKGLQRSDHEKKCTSCRKTKSLTQFNVQKRALRAADPNKYASQCKDCHKSLPASKVDPNFFSDIKPRKVGYDPTAAKQSVRRKTRIKILQYLAEKGCSECDEHDPRVLEFDHLDPSKKYKPISRLVCTGYSWASEVLRAEIRKCQILCANCHRKHTLVQQGYYADPEVVAALQEIDAARDNGSGRLRKNSRGPGKRKN